MTPGLSPAVLGKFPPTLLMSGTRDVALSNVLVTHMRLRQAGVDARLIVQEGMGHGDFKLFAALGAWFGWQALVPIILMASVIGAFIGIAMKLSSSLREGKYVPFGPFLAGAGLTAMIFGPASILEAIGL